LRHRRRAGVAALLFLSAAGCTVFGSGPTIDGPLARFVARAAELGGRVGVCVADAGSGVRLAASAADQGFVPASNLKLLTAAVALQTSGPAATLRTELLCTGEVQDGVLRGDLILRGYGDPTFGTPVGGDPRLHELAAAVRALGIRAVAGDVHGDGRWLGDERFGRGWEWDDLGERYAAPFDGLCYGGNIEWVRCDDGSARQVPVSDPAAFAAAGFTEILRAEGVEVAGGDVEALGAERLVAAVLSPPLTQLLGTLLRDSDNLYAEQLWRTAARAATGDGSSAGAEAHGKAVLAGLGVDTTGMVLADGSGLSRIDLVRPAQLVDLLLVLRRAPLLPHFVAALPQGGAAGTLQQRFTDGPARGRVFAKTGTLTRVTGSPTTRPLGRRSMRSCRTSPPPSAGSGQNVSTSPNWKPSSFRSAS
jgi:D-alanyl-D-alanine carboxypeptidase/D-alanyl-D-alanine-endopeptidase (penicillin-binding protein 4)